MTATVAEAEYPSRYVHKEVSKNIQRVQILRENLEGFKLWVLGRMRPEKFLRLAATQEDPNRVHPVSFNSSLKKKIKESLVPKEARCGAGPSTNFRAGRPLCQCINIV